jgi:hypothetical protein
LTETRYYFNEGGVFVDRDMTALIDELPEAIDGDVLTDGDILTMEVDLDCGTLSFFYEGVCIGQLSGVKGPVRW